MLVSLSTCCSGTTTVTGTHQTTAPTSPAQARCRSGILLDLGWHIQRTVALSEHIHVDRNQLANPKARIVHEGDDRLITLLE